MAYVFGMEGIPIFEMLFVVSVLSLIGLVFILLELKRLSTLISKEKSALRRFEDDLSHFENDNGKKHSDKLVEYIRTSLSRRLTRAQIENSLIQRGWPKEEVDKIFSSLGR